MVESTQSITLSFPFTWLDRLRASFALVPQRALSMAVAAAFPLFGLAFVLIMLVKGRPLTANAWNLIAICLLFYPAVLVASTTISHFCSRHLREPFTYTFNDSGIHVSAISYEYTHRWSTISHVKPFAGFLMFFFSPGCAHCIPLKVVQSAGALGPLLALARARGQDYWWVIDHTAPRGEVMPVSLRA
jgi:hypothetical protein